MNSYVAFIRNVMVGRRGLTREVLLGAFADCGASDLRSFLATGNVTFTSAKSPRTLSSELSRRLAAVADVDEPVFIRSVTRLKQLQALDPFAAAPGGEIYERCVTFLPCPLSSKTTLPIRGTRRDVDIFAVSSQDAFSVTRRVNGRPGQAGPILEDLVGSPVTTRNWNTVERILRAYDGRP